MENVNLFEKAVRGKMRFPFKGMISVEDLWDLSVRDLDSVFKTLNSKLKEVNEESLLKISTKEDEELQIKVDIIKYIVQTKLDEEAKKLEDKKNKERKEKIKEALYKKQEEDLSNLSKAQLEAMLLELE